MTTLPMQVPGDGQDESRSGSSEQESAEAMGEICVRAHDARLMHCSVDDRNPWPDADGPWRLEIPLAVLESTA